MMKAAPRSLSLLVKLLILVIGAVSIETLLSITATRLSLQDDIERLLLDQQQDINRTAIVLIEDELHTRQLLLESMARQLAAQPLIDAQAGDTLLYQRQPTLQRYFASGVVLLDAEGTAITESVTVEGRLGTNYADRPHIAAAMRSGKPVISEPILGRALGSPIISMVTPVLDSDARLVAVLLGTIDLQRDNPLKDAVSLTLGDQARLYVIDRNKGIYVTATEPGLAMQPLSTPADNPLLEALDNNRLEGRLRHQSGEVQLYAAAILPTTGWDVVTMVPYHQVDQRLQPILNRMLIIRLLSFTLLGLLLVVVLHHALRPLTRAAGKIVSMLQGTRPNRPIRVEHNDEVGRLVGAFNQLSEQRSHQAEALRQERDLLQSQFEQSSDGILLLEVDSLCIRNANQRITQLLGHSPASLYQVPFRQLLSNAQGDPETDIRRLVDSGAQAVFAFNCFPEGVISCEISAAQVGQDDTQLLMLNLRDISERQRIAHLKNEFVSTVSHELRTPLTAISGTLGLLNGGVLGPLGDQASALLSIAGQNATRLTQLINDLLDVEKLEAGKLALHQEKLLVAEILHSALASIQSYAAQYQVHCHADRVQATEVLADSQRVQQVLSNLLSNAIKFSAPGSTVLISVENLGDHARFMVSDQGCGIPLAFHDQVFEKFAQADASNVRQTGGSGLGLAITRELVLRMGGEIGFESKPGQGSRFWFTLPTSTDGEQTGLSPASIRAIIHNGSG